jgi:hypothetical protein
LGFSRTVRPEDVELVDPEHPRDRTGPAPADRDLEWLAWLMDQAFVVPGTNIRVGLDALLGLLPFAGDTITGLIQAGLVLVALHRYRVPKAVAGRMAANVLLDIAVGSIPLFGDVFDVFFKANTRNIQLLREAHAHAQRGEPMPAGPSTRWLIGLGALLGGAVMLVLILTIAAVVWLLRAHPATPPGL